ncbi:gliding motility-associated C-terminal domain-containing protein [Chitinophagaceae bacterium MMS25-I14]
MKVKATLLFILFLNATCMLRAQNLVPNSGFETYNNCPAALSGIDYDPTYTHFPTAAAWINPVQNSSPDYFNQCANAINGPGLPDAPMGYQDAHGGTADAGFIAWQGQYLNGTLITDYREYLQCRLLQPLVAGKKYCVSFYVSPTITSNYNFNYIAVNELGINLSAQQVSASSGYVLNLPYSVESNPGVYFTDTAKWYKINGIYTATGGERWLTIGCFKQGNNIPAYQQMYPATYDPTLPLRNYFYLDDVSVRPLTASDTLTSIHDTTICSLSGLNYTLNAPAGDIYLWNTGANTATLAVQDSGTFWCGVQDQCSYYIDTFHVRYKSKQLLHLGNDTVNCQNQPVVLTPHAAFDSYQWSTGDTTAAVTVPHSGTYILTVKDACGIQSDSVKVTIQPPTPSPVVSDTTICQYIKDPVIKVNDTGLHWYNYYYDITGFTTQPAISTVVPGKQVLYVSKISGACESGRIPVTVNIRYTPRADIGNYFSLCQQDTTRIGKVYDDVKYAWSTGDDICCIHPDHTGSYTFSIYNECGTSTDSLFVDISPCDNCVSVPTVFTPNNDGRNDIFLPLTTCDVRLYALHIYNRWGQKIFTTHNINEGWNGLSNGSLAETGVYVYVLEYISGISGREHFIKGNVTLLR